ncbi:DUF2163 domain-containing protein [Nitratireductor basaltis]|uniref:Bacteriophage phiJL001 Gp84 C-terminal domain-containing protein n=1 Tax=Nitratireductor basaltis TaxID=472175 RepID=A0A084UCF8_9HYPH|nr:DUF2163 domain-containing protein [Nitratireductor basaltis]KFB10644.1 hypothetical protein EL18_01682 [Nitratireductor basaltis]
MSGFEAHLAADVTTLCHCWRLNLRDGTVLGFTDHDRTLEFNGTTFAPESGLSASEARSSLGLTSDVVDVTGALSAVDITEADIVAGRYDGADVETYLVNWQAADEHRLLRKAVIGRITRKDGQFTAELEGLQAKLDETAGRTVRRSCDAELGDARCRFALGASHKASGTLVEMKGDTAIVSSLGSHADGWFTGGIVTWTSGAAAGRRERVELHRRNGSRSELKLWRETAAPVAGGDTFTVVAGCDKSFSTCRDKFSNVKNFQGFPHLPGNDAAYGYATESQEHDGRPLVP